MRLTLGLLDAAGAPLAEVGGKGRNLGALVQAGFAVPPGFVVTVAACELIRARAPWLGAAVAALDAANHDRLREQCDGLRARLAGLDPGPELRAALAAALDRLDEACPGAAVAVRSSSVLEDLAEAACAGQHDSFLNLRGRDAVLRGVCRCFASLWTDRAVLYRHHRGVTENEARMAVVVQRQLDCEAAGVAFSIDPVTARPDRISIDANLGLGDSVVSGEHAVDHFELDKRTLAVAERRLARKTHAIVPAAAGVAEVEQAGARADAPALCDSRLAELGDLVRRVERRFGWPQDVEWGLWDGRLWLFQSRPVTTVAPRWTRDEAAERFPGPITPLAWDGIRAAFRRSLAHSLELMGLPPFTADWFEVFDEHVYGNQSAVALLAGCRPLRADSLAELDAEAPAFLLRFEWARALGTRWPSDLERYLLSLGRIEAAAIEDAVAPELLRLMDELLLAASDYFRPNIAISMGQSLLHAALRQLAALAVGPEQGPALADALLLGCETRTQLVDDELHALARHARADAALAAELLDRGGRGFQEAARLAAYPEFAARLARFLERHGHRELDIDPIHPTWSGRPELVLDAVGVLLRSERAPDPAQQLRVQQQRQFAAEQRLLAQLPERLRFFGHEVVRLARSFTALDDVEHYQTTRVNPLARRIALALGRRLQQRGILDQPEDVFFFRKAELDACVGAGAAADAAPFRAAVSLRKRRYRASRRQPPPWSRDAAAPPEATRRGRRRGLAASAGRVTARCFLVRGPEDFARFPAGAVLVARATNPSWTPLFYVAAAVVAETGGPLSHGAVTARELRLPAVMSVRGVMAELRDGQLVTVDGSEGTVWLRRAGRRPASPPRRPASRTAPCRSPSPRRPRR